jgi:hypothetical protein
LAGPFGQLDVRERRRRSAGALVTLAAAHSERQLDVLGCGEERQRRGLLGQVADPHATDLGEPLGVLPEWHRVEQYPSRVGQIESAQQSQQR